MVGRTVLCPPTLMPLRKTTSAILATPSSHWRAAGTQARQWLEGVAKMAPGGFLRGINGGGHQTVRPTKLAQQLKRYDVVNIGAAGTFVVRRPISQSQLRVEFERRLPFQAEVIICRGGELLRAASVHRFGDAPIRPDVVRFVSVLSRRPRRPLRTPFDLPPDGRWL